MMNYKIFVLESPKEAEKRYSYLLMVRGATNNT